ncbi:MAG: BON domain-containing protein [Bacteroidota bacterium]
MNIVIKLFSSVMLTAMLGLAAISCKPKDADIQVKAAEALKSIAGVNVTVTDGVATLTGRVADEGAKAAAEAALKELKEVKSIVNSVVVTPPPPPVEVTVDDVLTTGVKSALTGFSGVVADVKDGIVTLRGNIMKADLARLMMAIQTLKPKKVENKLTIK